MDLGYLSGPELSGQETTLTFFYESCGHWDMGGIGGLYSRKRGTKKKQNGTIDQHYVCIGIINKCIIIIIIWRTLIDCTVCRVFGIECEELIIPKQFQLQFNTQDNIPRSLIVKCLHPLFQLQIRPSKNAQNSFNTF